MASENVDTKEKKEAEKDKASKPKSGPKPTPGNVIAGGSGAATTTAPMAPGFAEGGSTDVKDIDADSIIDAFLEENPDLVDVPVEEWPKEAIDMLKETFNSENVDAPNGVLPDEEDEEGAPAGAETEPEEPTIDVENPGQDFDILELSKLVEAGDKDGAWSMLQSMFGVEASGTDEPTNALGRMTETGEAGGGGNALARLLADLKY
jgi:hypothetical protein